MSQEPIWSNDGRWWWDGSQWRVAPGQPTAGKSIGFMPWIAGSLVLAVLMFGGGLWLLHSLMSGPTPLPTSNCGGLPTIGHTAVYFHGDGTVNAFKSPMFCMDNGTYSFAWQVVPKQIPPDTGILDCSFSVDVLNPNAGAGAGVIGDEYTFNVTVARGDYPFPAQGHRNGVRVPAHQYYLSVYEETVCEGAWVVGILHE